jgi:hypothetical protein
MTKIQLERGRLHHGYKKRSVAKLSIDYHVNVEAIFNTPIAIVMPPYSSI